MAWNGDAVAEGVHGINVRFPWYAGLYLPDFKNNRELEQGIRYALQKGAGGVSLFGEVTEKALVALEQASHSLALEDLFSKGGCTYTNS